MHSGDANKEKSKGGTKTTAGAATAMAVTLLGSEAGTADGMTLVGTSNGSGAQIRRHNGYGALSKITRMLASLTLTGEAPEAAKRLGASIISLADSESTPNSQAELWDIVKYFKLNEQFDKKHHTVTFLITDQEVRLPGTAPPTALEDELAEWLTALATE